jgi:hypothetical protein
MSLREAAKTIRLDAREDPAPSQYLATGGALMEFFIMAFGAKDDSQLLFRYTSARKRDRDLVTRTPHQIQLLMKQYTLRYDLFVLF